MILSHKIIKILEDIKQLIRPIELCLNTKTL